MDYQQLIQQMNPDIYQALKRAVEVGKWPDGRPLTAQQREHCMAAVIAYGERRLPEQERVGFIDRGTKEEGEMCDDDEHKPVKFLQ